MTTSVPVILGSLGTGPCQKNWKNWKCGNKSKMSRQQHYWNAWIVCVKETCCHLISTETVNPSPDTTGAKTEFEILIVNLQKSTRGGGVKKLVGTRLLFCAAWYDKWENSSNNVNKCYCGKCWNNNVSCCHLISIVIYPIQSKWKLV